MHVCMYTSIPLCTHKCMHAYTDTYTHSSHMQAGKRMNACAFMHFGASTGHRRRALRPRGKGPAACMHACFGVTADTHLLGAAEDGCMHVYTHREGPALHVRNFPALRESLRRVCGACEAHTGGGEKHCHDQCHLSPAPPHRRVHHHLWQCPAPRPHRPASLALCSVRG